MFVQNFEDYDRVGINDGAAVYPQMWPAEMAGEGAIYAWHKSLAMQFHTMTPSELVFYFKQLLTAEEKVAYQKNMILLTVKEIDDINVAELYKNGRILIPDAVAIALEEDEYYTRDLYGMKVVTDEGEDLGELVRIYETGTNDVYAVKKAEDKKELLLPAIKDCILKVDIKENTMTVHLLEGLR